MTILAQDSLFPVCPLPLCGNLVGDLDELCGECETATAAYIRRVSAPEPPAAAPEPLRPDEAGDKRMALIERAARQDLGLEYRHGQTCWVCEGRRSCRKDPEFLGTKSERWICRDCEAIPA